MRASTQAQSKAEVGTYRVYRKRTKHTEKSTETAAEPVPSKVNKTETDNSSKSSGKRHEKVENSVIKHTGNKQVVQSTSPQAGPSHSKDSKVQKKKSRSEKKSKKDKLLKFELDKACEESSTCQSPAPGLKSLRRQTRAKKTGSCASSR